MSPGAKVAVVLILLAAMRQPGRLNAQPVVRVVRAGQAGVELLKNGGFEDGVDSKLADWISARGGYVVGVGRNGSRGLECQSAFDNGKWFGASQTIVLNRTNPLPLLVSGWSKAQNVGGSKDNDYSLYVDLEYMDGTPLWGQTANFRTGTHDWERSQVLIVPEKPVKSLTLHCLFRNHSGVACFDDLSLSELARRGTGLVFQGTPVVIPTRPRGKRYAGTQNVLAVRSGDGLAMHMQNGRISSLKIGRAEMAVDAPSGFLARDVAADSDFYQVAPGGSCPELGLNLQANFQASSNCISVQGSVSNTRGGDRAIMLVFALPIDATGWHWGDDIRHERTIAGNEEFEKLVSIRCGATGSASLYPLGEVSSQNEGIALAIDMAKPAQYRIGYNSATKQLFIVYDFGLVPETAPQSGTAAFRFAVYRFEPRWGFRAAWQKLMTVFPEYFVVRSHDQGLWMPFTDISTVQGAEDFGFKYHEGNNNVPWDDDHGVLSFRYTEPMTWWMRMPPELPRTVPEALKFRDSLAVGAREPERQMAEVSRISAMRSEFDEPSLLFRNEPWCNGAVWSLNPNPRLPAGTNDASAGYNAATVHWNNQLKEALYGPNTKGRLDGEYLDSLEGYVTSDLNFRREHFRYTSVPLTFDGDTGKPALFKGLAVFEFTHWFCGDVHALGKLTFANGVPYRFTYLCPWLDVLGTETDWLRNGKYTPPSDEQMSLWRTMAGSKPYLLLMNTDFDRFTPDMVERYFQRALFYGMFPSMFSHNAADNPYWQNRKWYERDRPLFKRYMPVIKRVAQAGWQPVTFAKCDFPDVLVERFGSVANGPIYFTVLNDSDQPRHTRLTAELDRLGVKSPRNARELLSDRHFTPNAAWELNLEPQSVAVIECGN